MIRYPITPNVCVEIFRESAQLYYPLQDMDKVQNAISPLSGGTTHCVQTKSIQSTANLSRYCIQFGPVIVQPQSIKYTKSIYPVDSTL